MEQNAIVLRTLLDHIGFYCMRSVKAMTRWACETGAFRLSDNGLVAIDGDRDGPAVVYVPTENILLTVVDLPVLSRRQRMTALPFAIEDQIAGPLDTVHIALGAEIVPGSYLVGVVAHEKIVEWVSQLTAAGFGHVPIVPDALRLPIPLPASWSIEVHQERVIVRDTAGAGFASSAGNFLSLWEAAGSPSCTIYGTSSGIRLPATFQKQMGLLASRTTMPALDFRQGQYAAQSIPVSLEIRLMTIIAIGGIIAHTAIAGADVIIHRKTAAENRTNNLVVTENILPILLSKTNFIQVKEQVTTSYEKSRLLFKHTEGQKLIHDKLVRA